MHKVELCHLVCPAPRPGLCQPVIKALRQQIREQLIDDDAVQVLQVPDVLCCRPAWAHHTIAVSTGASDKVISA